jgi:hypothetical protein
MYLSGQPDMFLDVHTLSFHGPLVSIPYVVSDQSNSDGYDKRLEQFPHGSG